MNNNGASSGIPEIVKKLQIFVLIEGILWVIIGFLNFVIFILDGVTMIGQLIAKDFVEDEIDILSKAVIMFLFVGFVSVVLGISIIVKVFKLKNDYTGILDKYSFSPKDVFRFILCGCIILGTFGFIITRFFNIPSVAVVVLIPITFIINILKTVYVNKNADEYLALERMCKETETKAESEVKPDFEIKPEIKEEKQMPSYTEEKKADFSETPSRNKIICPVCGKEQIKNAFGCIYCHNKWE